MSQITENIIDVAIIGGGPAGLSAAINVHARNKTATVFGRGPETSYLYTAHEINNHLGALGKSGKALLDEYYSQASQLGINLHEGRVLQVIQMGDNFMLNVENNFVTAKTVIIATGLSKGSTVNGEEEFLGRGVSYCATCDGMLYRGKNVAVVGQIQEAVEDANFLNEVCSSVVFVKDKNLYRSKKDAVNLNGLNDGVKVVESAAIQVLGGDFVTGLRLEEEDIEVSGVFFIKESLPLTSFFPGIELEDNCVKVSRLMETNIPGVYACGDCTGWPYQLSKAVGEGLVAAQTAVRYINQH